MLEYVKPLDMHVHLRWNEYPDHDFARIALEQAAACGLRGIAEMPNTTPPLTTPEALAARSDKMLALAETHGVRWYAHAGLMSNLSAAELMIHELAKGPHGHVVGDKTYYAGSSNVGGVTDPVVQAKLWKLKAVHDYRGVSLGHFEEESLFYGAFDPTRPTTHSSRQNPTAETVSVERQLQLATKYGFAGTFYVCHVSNPATVLLVEDWRKHVAFEIVTEVTWHHVMLDTYDYKGSNRHKCNPPLRDVGTRNLLLQLLLEGHIDVISTDHAPHPLARKDDEVNPASGLPGIPIWPRGIQFLRDCGMSEARIADVTFVNANRIFKLGLEIERTTVDYDPKLWEAYGYNPYERYTR